LLRSCLLLLFYKPSTKKLEKLLLTVLCLSFKTGVTYCGRRIFGGKVTIVLFLYTNGMICSFLPLDLKPFWRASIHINSDHSSERCLVAELISFHHFQCDWLSISYSGSRSFLWEAVIALWLLDRCPYSSKYSGTERSNSSDLN